MVKTATKRKDNETASIKKRLFAALCMLLVSLIMLISSTYAWFTLSTAPEARNIATTVTGNGSLEIALMPESGLVSDIARSAGNSSSGSTPVTTANLSWGNVVDLNDISYGLGQITLNPAALNTTDIDTAPLAVPTYGFDGRAEALTETLLARWNGTQMEKFNGNYGVRAIATSNGGGDTTTSAAEDGTTTEVSTAMQDLATYGYVVDLAFRTNAVGADGANAKLLLQADGIQRIYADSADSKNANQDTMGGGSTMTFTGVANSGIPQANLTKLLEAMRITFVQNYGNGATDAPASQILRTAKLYNVEYTTDGTDMATAKIGFFKDVEKEVDGETVTVSELDTDQSLTELTKNAATQISAIVWLDGENITNAEVSALASFVGTLNLQFTTDVALVPANNNSLNTRETEPPVTVAP